jgi:hypothetical protein
VGELPGLGPDDVVLSDAFGDPKVVAHVHAAGAHRHAFSDLDELTSLFNAHRTARRIVVLARGASDDLRARCAEAAAVLHILTIGA